MPWSLRVDYSFLRVMTTIHHSSYYLLKHEDCSTTVALPSRVYSASSHVSHPIEEHNPPHVQYPPSRMIPPSRPRDRILHPRPYSTAQSHHHRQSSSHNELARAPHRQLRQATEAQEQRALRTRLTHSTHTFIEYLHSAAPAALKRSDERVCVFPCIPIRIRRNGQNECAQRRYLREDSHFARGHSPPNSLWPWAQYSPTRSRTPEMSLRRSLPKPLVQFVFE
jgi:hypothetical protein